MYHLSHAGAGTSPQIGAILDTLRTSPPDDIAALDDWIRTSEAAYPDIRPGNAKGIVWHGEDRQRKPWAVVYLHGFAASRLETAPLCDRVAQALGAHLFCTRLTGHGRTSDAMAQASEQDWMDDAQEALHIGRTLGERVLLISCSSGATLASRLATQPDAHRIAAHIFISPNFGPKNKWAELLHTRWGQWLALVVEGKYRSWTPADAREANAWTTRYPLRAVFTLMALVKRVRESDLSVFQTPLLVLYSERDQTVDPVEIRATFARIGAPLKTIEAIGYSTATRQHVLAGDITAPESIEPLAHTMVQWVLSLPP